MKIAIIVRHYLPTIGGIQTHISELSKALIKKKDKVDIYCSENKYSNKEKIKHKKYNGANVYYEKECQLLPGLRIPKIQSDADVIHIHNFDRLLFAATVLKYRKYKKMVTLHGGILGPYLEKNGFSNKLKVIYDKLFAGFLLRRIDKIIAINKIEKNFLIKSFKLNESKIIIISNGVPKDAFSNKLKSSNLNFGKYLITISRIHPLKKLDHIIKILPFLPSDINYVMAGPDGGDLKKLKKIVKDLKLEKRVYFYRPVFGQEKYTLIKKSLVFLVSSVFEIQNITLLEAMACKKIVIATRVGGIPEIIDNGVNGFLYNYGDLDSLQKCIKNIIKNRFLEKKVGNAAYNKVYKFYQWPAVAKKTIFLYEELYRKK